MYEQVDMLILSVLNKTIYRVLLYFQDLGVARVTRGG